jgi:hypothetical protein
VSNIIQTASISERLLREGSESMLIDIAIVVAIVVIAITAVFAVFSVVLAWADRQTQQIRRR